MPVLDHFRPPLLNEPPFETVHGTWIHYLMRDLNRALLPVGYRAVRESHFGRSLEVDVGVIREPHAVYYTEAAAPPAGPDAYRAPAPDAELPGIVVPHVRVLVYREAGGRKLVGAIELVSPGNKDRPEERRGFAAKLQSYLQSGVAVIVADIVTSPRGNLHNEWAAELAPPGAPRLPEDDGKPLYAAAYRPYEGEHGPRVHVWLRALDVGEDLPSLPLFLAPDLAVPIDLRHTYEAACSDVRVGEPEAAAV